MKIFVYYNSIYSINNVHCTRISIKESIHSTSRYTGKWICMFLLFVYHCFYKSLVAFFFREGIAKSTIRLHSNDLFSCSKVQSITRSHAFTILLFDPQPKDISTELDLGEYFGEQSPSLHFLDASMWFIMAPWLPLNSLLYIHVFYFFLIIPNFVAIKRWKI